MDASKDGGTWWFPQSPDVGFSASVYHQGTALAEYLKSLGFEVDELPRGAIITPELLDKYSKIIRTPAFFSYSDGEIKAYENFFKKSGSLLLAQDHLSNTGNDKLSSYLGVTFSGAITGSIDKFYNNEITNGVSNIEFIAGSAVINALQNPNIVILGSMTSNNYTVLNSSYPINGADNIDMPVMGLINTYRSTKIFFIGDINGLESVPQPFTGNLIHWLFE